MSKTSQTGALVLLLVLFVTCLMGAIVGFVNRGGTNVVSNENPEHLLYFDNKLWFYSTDGAELGKYSCETNNCKIAVATSNDKDYPYMDQDVLLKEFSLINNHFIFLQDSEDVNNAPIFLYDLNTSFAYKDNNYLSVKKYNSLNDYFIVQNSNKQFGMLRIGDYSQLVIPFEYNYIGVLPGDDHYIVLEQNGRWVAMDSSLNKLFNPIEQRIIGVSKEYIAVKDSDDLAYVINYDGLKILPEDYQNAVLVDKYVGVTTEDGEFIVYDLSTKGVIGEQIQVNANDKVSIKIENNELLIEVNGQKKSSIKLN